MDIQETGGEHLKVKERNFSRTDVVLGFAADLLDVATTPDGIAAQIKLKEFPLDSNNPSLIAVISMLYAKQLLPT
jgi:hypothetical protein